MQSALIKILVLAGSVAVCVSTHIALAGEIADVGLGTVELPEGFKQVHSQGIDSVATGSFVSADGKRVIYYDVGAMAGTYAKPEKVKDGDSYTEFSAGNRTAAMIISGSKPQRVTVSIGSINFFAEIQDQQDVDLVRSMAATFNHGPYSLYSHSRIRDDIFKRLIGQYIADEQAGEEKYQKPFWQAFYRKLRAQTSVGWEPTEFKGPADVIEYIKSQRRAHQLPVYGD